MQNSIEQSLLLRSHFDAVASRWDSLQAPDRNKKLVRLLMRFTSQLAESKYILEAGAGTGQLIPVLKKITPQSVFFAGDLAGEMLYQAQSKLADKSQTYFIQFDAHDLPMNDTQFDVVICHNALPHFVDKSAVLLEIHRVLQKGGTLLILHDASREVIHAMHQRIGEPVSGDFLPDTDEMQQLLIETGYRDILVEDTDESYIAVASK